MLTDLPLFMDRARDGRGLSLDDVRRQLAHHGVDVSLSGVSRWFTPGRQGRTPGPGQLAVLFDVLALSAKDRLRALSLAADEVRRAHRRTTTVATEGTDSRNGPTVLEGLASTSIGVSSAAQDVSGRAEERVSNMVTSGDPLNVAPPHRHTQPSERDE